MNASVRAQAIERLEKAAETVRKSWVKGTWNDAEHVCAAGSIMVAQKPDCFSDWYYTSSGSVNREGKIVEYNGPVFNFVPDEVSLAAFAALALAISGKVLTPEATNESYAEVIGIIAPWNDNPERTQEEVVAMLQAAAVVLRAAEDTTTAEKLEDGPVKLEEEMA